MPCWMSSLLIKKHAYGILWPKFRKRLEDGLSQFLLFPVDLGPNAIKAPPAPPQFGRQGESPAWSPRMHVLSREHDPGFAPRHLGIPSRETHQLDGGGHEPADFGNEATDFLSGTKSKTTHFGASYK